MKQARSLSEFSRPSEFTQLYPILMALNQANFMMLLIFTRLSFAKYFIAHQNLLLHVCQQYTCK